jgi:hypothetical protein
LEIGLLWVGADEDGAGAAGVVLDVLVVPAAGAASLGAAAVGGGAAVFAPDAVRVRACTDPPVGACTDRDRRACAPVVSDE